MITPNRINEAQVIPLRQYVNAMVASKFGQYTSETLKSELKYAIVRAIIPVLKKYGYIIQNNTEYDFTGVRDVDLDESIQHEMTQAITEDLRKWFDQDWVRFDTKGKIKGGEPINVKTELAEKLNLFLEKNVPNDPGKWSYAKSQAKEKYDVYPSAYANAWASKKYKELGGTWRKAK